MTDNLVKRLRVLSHYVLECGQAADRIETLEAALQDTLAYLDQYVDVVDGDDGVPAPNAAMSLATMIEEVLK
jgi:hypothetical protein